MVTPFNGELSERVSLHEAAAMVPTQNLGNVTSDGEQEGSPWDTIIDTKSLGVWGVLKPWTTTGFTSLST